MKLKGTAQQLFVIFALSFLAAGIQAVFFYPPSKVNILNEGEISTVEALLNETSIWIDAREVSAFETDHFPGAINLNLENWNEGLYELLTVWDGQSSIYVYCDGEDCRLSQEISHRLKQELESTDVYWIKGGWEHIKKEIGSK